MSSDPYPVRQLPLEDIQHHEERLRRLGYLEPHKPGPKPKHGPQPKFFWNNGVVSMKSETQPGPEWKRGFLKPEKTEN